MTDLGSCPPWATLQKSGLDRTKGTSPGDCPEGLERPGGDPVYNSGAGKAEWSLGPLVKGLEYPGEVARWVSEQLPALHWNGLSLSAKVGGGGGTMAFFTQLSSPSYSGS